MMNARLITLCFLLFNLLGRAQDQEKQIPTNEKSGLAEYTEVVTVSGASAQNLYDRAMKWAKEFFPNAAGAISTNDTAVKIAGKHQFRLELADKKGNKSPAGFVTYDFSIEFKDGKYKYVINNINEKRSSAFDISRWEDKDDPTYNEERYTQFIKQALEFFNKMIDSLEEAMATPIEEEDSDW